MSPWRDMALDAGYRGAEADQVAAMLEHEAMAEAAREADYYRDYYREMEAAHNAAQEREFAAEVWASMPVHDPPRPA